MAFSWILVVLLSPAITTAFNIRFPFSRSAISTHEQLNTEYRHSTRYHSTKTTEINTEDDDKILRQTALMISLWEKISFPPDTETEGDQGVEYKLSDFGLNRADVRGFLNHFQNCKDCAADNAFLIATQNSQNEDVLKLTSINFPLLSEDEDDEEWSDFDNYFDEEIKEGAEDNVDGSKRTKVATEVEGDVFPIEHDDEIVLQHTKDWVRKMIVDLGICPFTINPDKAGIPLGGVRYTLSRAHGIDEAFFRFWQEVAALLITTEKEISTVLLVFPEIELFGNFELFEGYCDALNDALCSSCMNMESKLQLVFFHPRYQFRDGKARLTSDEQAGAANFARRSPWPMINILRTNQVRAAQKGIPTGQVYYQNEEKLCKVGTSALQRMLTTRNWDDLPSYSTPGKLLLAAQKSAAATSGAISEEDRMNGMQESSSPHGVDVRGSVPAGVCPYIPPSSAAVVTENSEDMLSYQETDINNEEYDSGWPAFDSTLESSESVGQSGYYDEETQQYTSVLASDNTYVAGIEGNSGDDVLRNSEEYDAGWPDQRHSQSTQQDIDDLEVHMQGINNTEEYDEGWPVENSVLQPQSVGYSSDYDDETQQYASALESDNTYVSGAKEDTHSSEGYDEGWPTQSHSQQLSYHSNDNDVDESSSNDSNNSEEYDEGWPAEGEPQQSYDAELVAVDEEQSYSSILEADTYSSSDGDSETQGNNNNSEEYDAGWPDQDHSSSSSSHTTDDSENDSKSRNSETFDESLF